MMSSRVISTFRLSAILAATTSSTDMAGSWRAPHSRSVRYLCVGTVCPGPFCSSDRYVIRTRNLQDWNLTRYRCANRSKLHPVGFEPTPPKRLGLKSNALDQLGHGYDTAKRDRYVIRTRNLQDWNLTRCRCANRSKCIRWGSNPRLRRDWGLNPTPSWFIVDERPTRPRILNGRRAIGETTPTGLEPATPRFEV